MTIIVSLTVFDLQATSSDISIVTSALFWFLFSGNFFLPFIFNVCVLLKLKWLSCRQHIVGFFKSPFNYSVAFDLENLICLCLVEVTELVTQSCPSLCSPMDCNLPCSSAHGILQDARWLQLVAIPFSSGSFPPRLWTQISCLEVDSLPQSYQGSCESLSRPFPSGSMDENLPASPADMDSIPCLGRFHMLWSN